VSDQQQASRRSPLRTGSGITALVAAGAALCVSIYLTIEHYNRSVLLACPENSAINCAKVTTSRWSHIAGVPVAVIGLGYFVVMTALLAVPTARRQVQLLRVALAGCGVLMVLYLVYVELFEVNAICLYCTAVHVLTVVMFGATLWAAIPDAGDGGKMPAT
jgi:uncharacterized membrane protein